MFRGARVAVVMPAFNESRLIERAIRAVPGFVDAVFVIDDGSFDATGHVAARADSRVRVLRHERNRGVGAAIASGYRRAFADGADIAVVMAGDAQMDGADVAALLAPLVDGAADYVKGDRLSHPDVLRAMPLTRWMGNHVLSLATRIATRLSIRDSQCGFTALTRDAAQRLPLDDLWPRYGYPNDLLAMLAGRRMRVVDVCVRPIYRDETSGVRLRDAIAVVPFVIARSRSRRAVERCEPAARDLAPLRTRTREHVASIG